ncbi:UNVERIFIED_CONTAM: hypothetical protein Sradi_2511900 [Sesamum radiatum]|uniref:Uncharacterized protein n=1 Tax=Sesamum radiatum TaxID=300843 RepID=A0AAW2SMN1_SESRA
MASCLVEDRRRTMPWWRGLGGDNLGDGGLGGGCFGCEPWWRGFVPILAP